MYALILEVVIFRSVHIKQIPKIALSTGLVTSAVFVLVAGGQVFTYLVNLERIPQLLSEAVLGTDPSSTYVLLIVTLFFFLSVVCLWIRLWSFSF